MNNLEKAYEIKRKYVDLSDPQIESALNNLITIYRLRGRHEDAKDCLEEALHKCEICLDDKDNYPTHIGFIYRNLGFYYEKNKA
ncbi:tetratricopeptide repeat protein (plasmid) [Acaryochloris sp. 'Moss Beach']|uniref:tetratricopeptide repeat protein n=1 Tax=Acaryochloris sp. 'Moss Beach' TaxID=2740837 RepID=UPI001F2285C5|nr:tetratricopeptide repeat protein [Acaryochloris sp. 'Moss Beach']UJB73369.1 tetratricopeptide repeat protein [Acaryochloris sp. 'Moss Beach']